MGTSSTSAPGTSNVFFTTTTPTLYGNLTTTTTPTSDAGGTNTALPIMAKSFGDTVTAGVNNYSLVTYDAATGIRPLSSTEYSTNTLVSGTSNGTANNPGSTNNFIESNTNVALTANTNTAVNSITLENGATISGPGTLQSWSNIYAANGGNNTFSQGDFSGGSSNTNTYFYVMGATTVLNVSTNITQGQMEVAGEGTFVFSGTNTSTNGSLQINGGTFKVGNPNWTSPSWGNLSIAGGATLDLNGFSSTIYAYGNGFDGSGTITNSCAPAVLTLQGDQVVQAPFVGNITGGANVTIVKAGPNYSMELGGSASTFTGGIIVNSGVLQLDGAGSSGGAGNPITVNANQVSVGVIGIGYNVANQAALNITSGSSGVLGLNGYGVGIASAGATAPFTANLNMATLGNGSMFLGAENILNQFSGSLPSNRATYGGTSLGAGAGGTYRLGGGGGYLTISNNILTAGTNLVVGQVGGDYQLPIVAFNNRLAGYGVMNGQGDIKFSLPQTSFNGTITVNGGNIDQTQGNVSTTLEVAIPATSGQAIGTGTTNVTLNGGQFQVDPPSSSTPNSTASFGTLTAIGGPAQLATNANTNDGGSTITFANFVRDNNAALYIGDGDNNIQQGPLFNNSNNRTLGTGGTGAGTGFIVANSSGNPNTAIGNIIPSGVNGANIGTNGMVSYGGAVAPWIIYSNPHEGGEFLSYNATTGFAATTYTYQNVANGVVDGVTNLLNNALDSDIVQIEGSDASLTGGASKTIYALSNFFYGGSNSSVTGTRGATITSSGPARPRW